MDIPKRSETALKPSETVGKQLYPLILHLYGNSGPKPLETVGKQNRDFTTVSRDRHVRSYERVAPSTARSQFYYSFARSTRTILRKGSSGR